MTVPALTVDADFPGGNIRVISIQDRLLTLAQDLRDTDGHWFYWYCRIRGAAGQRITVVMDDYDLLPTPGPAVSFDGGLTWQWQQVEALTPESFELQVPADAAEVRLSMGIPCVHADIQRELAPLIGTAHCQKKVLATSEQGRSIDCWRIGALQPRYRLLLTSRHHCCEAVATYALIGFAHYCATGTDAVAQFLRNNVEILLVPQVDVDGCEQGDQGKNRKPHDHNRDYADAEAPIYAGVRAVKELVASLKSHPQHDGVDIALDFHCPYIRNPDNDRIFIVGARPEQQDVFARRLLQHHCALQQGELRLRDDDYWPHGEGWNTFTGPPRSCSDWLRGTGHARFAVTVEVAYALHREQAVTAAGVRALGADFARSTVALLQDRDFK